MFYSHIWHPPFEEGDPKPPESKDPKPGDPAPGAQPEPDAAQPPKVRTFTQDEFNKALAEDRRKHQEQTRKAIAEAEALRSKARLTQEERDELDKRLEQMKNELLTKEELAKKEQERLKKAHQTALQEVTSERDTWKDKYTNASIRRAITDAAVKNDAYNPHQIVRLLQPDTRLVEVLDPEGKPTGDLTPKVRYSESDAEGNPKILEMSPEEAIKRMREQEEYLNLFKGEGAGGLGANNQPRGKKTDLRELAKDPEAYRKARAEGLIKF